MFQLDTDIYTKNRQMNLAEKMGSQSMAASQQEMGLNDEKMKSAKIERAVQYLSMATPENWPAIRSQAISEGLGNEQVIPQQFDPNWIQQTKSAFLTAGGKVSDGGSTGVLVDRLMKENPGMKFGDALYQVQTGYRQNMTSNDGNLSAMMGAPEAKGALKYGETMGGKQAELEMNPAIARQEAQEKEVGKNRGEKIVSLTNQEAALPDLETAVSELSDLGKKATYTTTGRIADAIVRETGPATGYTSTEGAVARGEYMAKVDNVILPLLRDTFGAQFTLKEGQDLRATLGDPNISPEEKDAKLRAFIDQKRANIRTAKRGLGEVIAPADGAAPAPSTAASQKPRWRRIPNAANN